MGRQARENHAPSLAAVKSARIPRGFREDFPRLLELRGEGSLEILAIIGHHRRVGRPPYSATAKLAQSSPESLRAPVGSLRHVREALGSREGVGARGRVLAARGLLRVVLQPRAVHSVVVRVGHADAVPEVPRHTTTRVAGELLLRRVPFQFVLVAIGLTGHGTRSVDCGLPRLTRVELDHHPSQKPDVDEPVKATPDTRQPEFEMRIGIVLAYRVPRVMAQWDQLNLCNLLWEYKGFKSTRI